MSKPKNSKDALEFIHTLDSLAIKKQKEEIDRLKAMDSLKTVSLTDSTNWQAIGDYAETKEENARLKAEVERLRKAGDAMAFIMAYEKDEEFDGFVKAWKQAKEGKQS